MSNQHKAPLAAFVAITIVGVMVLAQAVRSEATWLPRPAQERLSVITAGVLLPAVTATTVAQVAAPPTTTVTSVPAEARRSARTQPRGTPRSRVSAVPAVDQQVAHGQDRPAAGQRSVGDRAKKSQARGPGHGPRTDKQRSPRTDKQRGPREHSRGQGGQHRAQSQGQQRAQSQGNGRGRGVGHPQARAGR